MYYTTVYLFIHLLKDTLVISKVNNSFLISSFKKSSYLSSTVIFISSLNFWGNSAILLTDVWIPNDKQGCVIGFACFLWKVTHYFHKAAHFITGYP